MKFVRKHLAALAITGLIAAGAFTARADEWNKRTVITIDKSVQLPNVTLEPGTYVFKLLDSPSDRHIVQVFDRDERKLITTVLAMNNYRLEPKGKTTLTFWETPAGMPPAVRAWFYPGDLYGQEFAYPKYMSKQLAAENKTAVLTTAAQNSDEMKTAPITSTNEVGDQNQVDKNTYTAPTQTADATPAPAPQSTAAEQPAPTPAPEPAPAPEPQTAAPEPAPTQPPAELPHTGSEVPLLGLIGVGALAGFAALSLKQNSR